MKQAAKRKYPAELEVDFKNLLGLTPVEIDQKISKMFRWLKSRKSSKRSTYRTNIVLGGVDCSAHLESSPCVVGDDSFTCVRALKHMSNAISERLLVRTIWRFHGFSHPLELSQKNT